MEIATYLNRGRYMNTYDRILITGAAGRLGSQLRKGLVPHARILRLAHHSPIGDLSDNEEPAVFDLSDMAATIAATDGCDAIVHFGGAAMEGPWQTILDSNIRGSYHIYEGARKHGAKRVIFASSVHAIATTRSIHKWIGCTVDRIRCIGWSKTFVESLTVFTGQVRHRICLPAHFFLLS